MRRVLAEKLDRARVRGRPVRTLAKRLEELESLIGQRLDTRRLFCLSGRRRCARRRERDPDQR